MDAMTADDFAARVQADRTRYRAELAERTRTATDPQLADVIAWIGGEWPDVLCEALDECDVK